MAKSLGGEPLSILVGLNYLDPAGSPRTAVLPQTPLSGSRKSVRRAAPSTQTKESAPWPLRRTSASVSCWRPGFTSVTRRAVGTREMRRFIWGERGGIYIIDLLQTERLLRQAQEFVGDLAARGGTVLFVGTKKQARDSVKEVAEACGMPHINHRWLGGLLTNFQTINQAHQAACTTSSATRPTASWRCCRRVKRLSAEADLVKLRANLGGVKNMTRTPDRDLRRRPQRPSSIGVREAQRLRIPLIGLVDTNWRSRRRRLRHPGQRRRDPLLRRHSPRALGKLDRRRRRGSGRPPRRPASPASRRPWPARQAEGETPRREGPRRPHAARPPPRPRPPRRPHSPPRVAGCANSEEGHLPLR